MVKSYSQKAQSAYKSGLTAARKQIKLASKEKLKVRNNYTDEQAEAYIAGHKSIQYSPDEKQIRKAELLARKAIENGKVTTDEEILVKKYNFTPQQIKVYLAFIKKKNLSAKALLRNKAHTLGRNAGVKGNDEQYLKKMTKKYSFSPEEIQVYLKAYNEANKRRIERGIKPRSPRDKINLSRKKIPDPKPRKPAAALMDDRHAITAMYGLMRLREGDNTSPPTQDKNATMSEKENHKGSRNRKRQSS